MDYRSPQNGYRLPNLCYCERSCGREYIKVKHRTVEYDVQEVQPGLWRWNIYPGNRVVQGPPHFRTRELAVQACHGEINNGIERTQNSPDCGTSPGFVLKSPVLRLCL
jgi:hypothetical protein